MPQTAKGLTLCYQSAALVGTPAGEIAQLAVYGRDGAQLGTLDGVLLEPDTGRFSHLVVKRNLPDGARRNLVPVESLIYLTCGAGTARLEVDADALETSDLDLESMPPMSEAMTP
jgi:hypothetical protein